MSRSTLIAIAVVIVVVILGGAFYLFGRTGTTSNNAANTNMTNTNTGSNGNMPSTSPPPASQNVVTYTDAGFSPGTLTVHKGDTVVFKNSASDDVRVASNPHPIHNGYPTTGGCVNSTFDSCQNIPPGSTWSFTFDFVGSWGYHNHLNPGEGGTIVVQ